MRIHSVAKDRSVTVFVFHCFYSNLEVKVLGLNCFVTLEKCLVR